MPSPLVTSCLVLGCAIVLFGVWRFLRGWRKTHYTFAQYILFRSVRFLVVWQWRTRLPEHLPFDTSRGAVIVCNHRSSIDPFFIQVMLDRRAHWMVAREYVEHWAFGWFLRICEVIPTNRNGIDTASTKYAIRHASAGHIIGMLPEGRINTTDDLLLPGRPGPILVALRAKVPIIPVYIHDAPYAGTVWSPFFRRSHTRVIVGDPIDLSEHYDREPRDVVAAELTLVVLKQLATLAGHPEFEPKLAPRRWKHDLPGTEQPVVKNPG